MLLLEIHDFFPKASRYSIMSFWLNDFNDKSEAIKQAQLPGIIDNLLI